MLVSSNKCNLALVAIGYISQNKMDVLVIFVIFHKMDVLVIFPMQITQQCQAGTAALCM